MWIRFSGEAGTARPGIGLLARILWKNLKINISNSTWWKEHNVAIVALLLFPIKDSTVLNAWLNLYGSYVQVGLGFFMFLLIKTPAKTRDLTARDIGFRLDK